MSTADAPPAPPRQTPLFASHQALGAKLIDFGGWHMPVSYPIGTVKEHKAVRAAAGLFDVSHMGEAGLRGPRAAEAVQRVVTNDVSKLRDGAAMYTVMCTETGGIVDDCIVYRRAADDFLIILNAGNIDKDLAWLRRHAADYDAEVVDESDATALIAVQGPAAVTLVASLSPDELAAVAPFHFARADVAGVPCMAARTGYTGEDGFELACPADAAVTLWDALLVAGERAGTVAVGLGARDTLRLEARLCLYGNDIDETTTPYEAGLAWVVKPEAGDFVGKEALLASKAAGVGRRLVGFHIGERAIPRHGYDILAPDGAGAIIGAVTSGTRGISVDGSIGMGYVPAEHAAVGASIIIDCRGKPAQATIVRGKFYQRPA